MQTKLISSFLETAQGQQADKILRSCVHCGFCTATCPTYQLLGDELDSPRGRIYLIKQMLEGNPVSDHTRLHLDRCLTCRACETTCPSGVEYGKLVDLGREWIETRTTRPLTEKIKRLLLRKIIPYPSRFGLLLKLARMASPFLPAKLKQKIPKRPTSIAWPDSSHKRKMLILNGCAQSVTHPHIDNATAVVLDRFGIQLVRAAESGCCGALDQHLAARPSAREHMKRNIDAWWPLLNGPVENLIINASGCAVHIKEYAYYFQEDPEYREKAGLISDRTLDLSELLESLPFETLVTSKAGQTIAFHSPCTLQHGQQINQKVEPLLERCGYQLTTVRDAHLCCGSAGTYSILQPVISGQLLDNKLDCLTEGSPDCIATANIGCLMHLQSQSPVPVVHWIELIQKAII